MDATQLGYFDAVCREGSYAKAAEKLYISPQGLSKAIHKLEAELGVSLFESTGSSLSLTEYGRLLRKHSTSYLNAHQQILNELDVMKRRAEHELTIGVKAGFTDGLGENFLFRFIEQHSEINVRLRAFPLPALHEAMKKPERSVWILPGPYDASLYESIYEHREKMFLIVGRGHPLYERESVSVRELAAYPRIALPHDIGQKYPVEQAMAGQADCEPNYLLDIADRELTMNLVRKGLAISFNSGWYYKRYEGIRRLELEDLDVTVKANVLVRRDAPQTPALQAFRQYVADWRKHHPEMQN